MSILPLRNNQIKQILQNTQDIMTHLGLVQKTLDSHDRQLNVHTYHISDHADRLQAIEQALIERGVLHSGKLVVPSTDTMRIAADEGMSIRELYQLLTDRGIIQPAEDRTSMVMRINGVPVRVVAIKGGSL